MIILSIKTDQETAELNLIKDGKTFNYCWVAGRSLSIDIHQKITGLLSKHGLELSELNGIIVFRGPGSFTGLRIGISVANALAYGLAIPIVGSLGDNWLHDGLTELNKHQNDKVVIPHYGSEPNITQPRK